MLLIISSQKSQKMALLKLLATKTRSKLGLRPRIAQWKADMRDFQPTDNFILQNVPLVQTWRSAALCSASISGTIWIISIFNEDLLQILLKSTVAVILDLNDDNVLFSVMQSTRVYIPPKKFHFSWIAHHGSHKLLEIDQIFLKNSLKS